MSDYRIEDIFSGGLKNVIKQGAAREKESKKAKVLAEFIDDDKIAGALKSGNLTSDDALELWKAKSSRGDKEVQALENEIDKIDKTEALGIMQGGKTTTKKDSSIDTSVADIPTVDSVIKGSESLVDLGDKLEKTGTSQDALDNIMQSIISGDTEGLNKIGQSYIGEDRSLKSTKSEMELFGDAREKYLQSKMEAMGKREDSNIQMNKEIETAAGKRVRETNEQFSAQTGAGKTAFDTFMKQSSALEEKTGWAPFGAKGKVLAPAAKQILNKLGYDNFSDAMKSAGLEQSGKTGSMLMDSMRAVQIFNIFKTSGIQESSTLPQGINNNAQTFRNSFSKVRTLTPWKEAINYIPKFNGLGDAEAKAKWEKLSISEKQIYENKLGMLDVDAENIYRWDRYKDALDSSPQWSKYMDQDYVYSVNLIKQIGGGDYEKGEMLLLEKRKETGESITNLMEAMLNEIKQGVKNGKK